MFTQYTYQDWQLNPTPEMVQNIVRAYKSSNDFMHGLEAERYFAG